MLYKAKNLEEAYKLKGEFRAGATDFSARYKLGMRPNDIVDISELEDLTKISWNEDGSVYIGALVKIETLANDEKIKNHYPALAQAAGGLATPQIRAMATVGGNLLQRTRCWYYRHPQFKCFKKGGNTCPARTGNHQFGVCFDLGPCVYPHPSTLGMAFLCYEASVAIFQNFPITIEQLYGLGANPNSDHKLGQGDLLTHIILPKAIDNERGLYTRTISRFEAEWPLVEMATRMVTKNNLVHSLKIALGGVANVPIRALRAENALIGKAMTYQNIEHAAERAISEAKPLPMTGYKVDLVYGTVLDNLLKISGLEMS